jgi:zinc protease
MIRRSRSRGARDEEAFMALNVLRSLSVCLALTMTAPGAMAEETAIAEIAYQRFVLPNGLTLVVHEDHKAPIVAVNVWYHVGSKNERLGKTGFAHLFEHLMFNGSEHYNDDYFKVLERIGATDLNGTTNNDRTNYFQNVPVSALDTVLWMESDRMGHLVGVIDKARLDEQRGVVQNEKRQSENEPYGLAYSLIQENTYPKGHPYSWTVIGSMEDLGAASLEDVKEWFATYYGAANAVIVIAGDVRAEEVRRKVESYFGHIPSGPPLAKHAVWVAPMSGTHRQQMQDRVPQARVYKVWNTPEWGSPDDDYLGLVAAVLATGKTSRLYKRLVYDDQIATAVNAAQWSAEIGSQFGIDATTRPAGDLAAVERAVDEEWARFLASGPTAEELQRVKTAALARFTRGIERIGGFGGKSDVLAESQVYGGRPDFYRTRLERVQKATAADLWNAAKRWLGDGVYVLDVHPFPEYAAAKADVDRTKRPEPGPPPATRFPAFQRARLASGLEVIVAERHAVPVVSFQLLVDAGYASDQFALPGTASLAGSMLDEGTRTRTSLQISEELAQLGAELSTASNLDLTTVSFSALKSRLGPSLEVLADVVLNPAFPAADFERLKKEQLARIQQEKAAPIPIALRVMPRLLYGEGHAYANPLTGSGTEASVEKMTRDDLSRFHATWFKPGNATLIVVGDTTLAEIQPRLEKLFATWKGGDVPRKNIASVPPRPKPSVYLLDRPGAIQSLILAGHVAPPKANPREIAIETMNAILGGQFTSRLNMNLREDKHWSYGAGSIFWDARGQRPFIAYAPVQSDKTRESVAEVLKELKGIAGAIPITADELKFAQTAQTLTLPGQWETAGAVSASLAQIVRFGLDDRYFDSYAPKVLDLALADVAEAAKVVRPDQVVWVIVGDRAKIEPGIRELNLGPITVIDPDGTVVGAAAGQ